MSNQKKGINKPYYRIYRANHMNDAYILDSRYADDRYLLCRAYEILEEDLLKLFQYIEPADGNENAFSYRTYELLLRAATEFETNCKKILFANGYKRSNKKDLNMNDYKKIENATNLSRYKVKLNIWHPKSKVFQPLFSWGHGKPLDWYTDYNNVKHDRSNNFQKAKLINVINAISAVWAILYAQFSYYAFEPYNESSGFTIDNNAGFEYSDNTLFSIKPFRDWKQEEKYIFKWPINSNNPFQPFQF